MRLVFCLLVTVAARHKAPCLPLLWAAAEVATAGGGWAAGEAWAAKCWALAPTQVRAAANLEKDWTTCINRKSESAQAAKTPKTVATIRAI